MGGERTHTRNCRRRSVLLRAVEISMWKYRGPTGGSATACSSIHSNGPRVRNRLPAQRTLVIVGAIAAPLTSHPRVRHMQISALVTLDSFIGPATMLPDAVEAGLFKPWAGGACMVSRRYWRWLKALVARDGVAALSVPA